MSAVLTGHLLVALRQRLCLCQLHCYPAGGAGTERAARTLFLVAGSCAAASPGPVGLARWAAGLDPAALRSGQLLVLSALCHVSPRSTARRGHCGRCPRSAPKLARSRRQLRFGRFQASSSLCAWPALLGGAWSTLPGPCLPSDLVLVARERAGLISHSPAWPCCATPSLAPL